MWSTVSTIVGFTLLVFLAVAILPVPRVRRLLLTGTARLVQTALLAFLGACGTFFVDPQAAPDWLTAVARPLLEGTLGLTLDAASGLPWLFLAVLAVGLSLPLLIIVELAVHLSSLTSRAQALRKQVRQTEDWGNGRRATLGASGPVYFVLPDEATAAAEALRAAKQTGKPKPVEAEPLPAVPLAQAAPAPVHPVAAPAPVHSTSPHAAAPAAATPQPAAAPAPAPLVGAVLAAGAQPRLLVLRGQKRNIEYPIYEGLNFIGRADEKPVDIDLEDQEPPDRIWCSRQHACLSFENNEMFLEDLNSANGTYVNRTRIYPGQKRQLAPNDITQIGNVQLKVLV